MESIWRHVGNRQRCVDNAKRIREACVQQHHKEFLVECDECYGKVLDQLQGLYAPERPRRWYSFRRGLSDELQSALQPIRQLEEDPRRLEEWLAAEKKTWYRDVAGTCAKRFVVDDDITKRDDFLDKLDDRDIDIETLRAAVNQLFAELVGPGITSGEMVDRILQHELQAPGSYDEYRNLFFLDHGGDNPSGFLPGAEKYFELLRQGYTLDGTIDLLLEDRQTNTGARLQREKHLKRLEELRRARTAHENEKAKKQRDREARAAEAQALDEIYRLPPCAVCSNTTDAGEYYSCSVCQVLVILGFQTHPTVYCQSECFLQGNDLHLQEAHPCASGGNCVRLLDEDVDMKNGDDHGSANGSGAELCEECIRKHGMATIYCSPRCAGADFQRHREEVHLPGRKKLSLAIDDSSSLVPDDGGKENGPRRYHAADIRMNLISVRGEVIREYEKNENIYVTILE